MTKNITNASIKYILIITYNIFPLPPPWLKIIWFIFIFYNPINSLIFPKNIQMTVWTIMITGYWSGQNIPIVNNSFLNNYFQFVFASTCTPSYSIYVSVLLQNCLNTLLHISIVISWTVSLIICLFKWSIFPNDH